jgi:hypothetical protein
MKRYVRLFPKQLAVGETIITSDWQEVDLTADEMERIAASGQVDVAEAAPTGVPPIAHPILAAELTAAATAGALEAGAIYLVTDTGALAYAADASTATILAAAE